ncbi:hypothetical protein SAMN06313486_1052 [Epsilonproteobacteria bacterium SCGC AD-308-P11]|jgi:hypothetical protein|nr:hypothetical protein SAMN06313486_1052 [Epsilonproteobacteria bacterium SCGC AD-308-P11]SMP88924.1 hypothetical protein SAMN06314042_11417 [Epsilonproteobacteria bacterium SCGC AD-308-O04]
MRVISVNPRTQSIEELDLDIKANTIYSFFNSILTDEMAGLNRHIIHSDANALSLKKRPYFIGEQIVIGDALIIGQNELAESDASIPLKDLEVLINYDVSPFYLEVLDLVSDTDINLYRTFEVTQNDEKLQLNVEWVLYTFNIADERTKEYFINELKKALDSELKIEDYMAKMAQLAINAAS